jgi:hypothetical protein
MVDTSVQKPSSPSPRHAFGARPPSGRGDRLRPRGIGGEDRAAVRLGAIDQPAGFIDDGDRHGGAEGLRLLLRRLGGALGDLQGHLDHASFLLQMREL